MSFGESVFSAGLIEKTIKVDPNVRINHNYLQQKQPQKVAKDFMRQTTKAEGRWLPGWAGWPHLHVGQPLGPLVSLPIVTRFSTTLGFASTLFH